MAKAVASGMPKLRIEEAAAKRQGRIDSGQGGWGGVGLPCWWVGRGGAGLLVGGAGRGCLAGGWGGEGLPGWWVGRGGAAWLVGGAHY